LALADRSAGVAAALAWRSAAQLSHDRARDPDGRIRTVARDRATDWNAFVVRARRVRLSIGRWMRLPATDAVWGLLSAGRTATILHGMAIWGWHAPLLFDAAVSNLVLHRLQHLSFFLTAVLFWWSVFRRSETGAAAWHVFITMLHTSVLGALMALAPHLLYREQQEAAAAWGLTPLEDQQLAGVIMWVPAGTIYAGAALTLIALWITRAAKQTERTDAPHAQ
jgi:cytochrome c oxidase assembly factor CtaG